MLGNLNNEVYTARLVNYPDGGEQFGKLIGGELNINHRSPDLRYLA